MTTILQAIDDLMGSFRTAWLANVTSAPVPLFYDDVVGDIPSGQDAEGRALPWARLTARHNLGTQDSLGDVGNRRFLNSGLFTVQIFAPSGEGGIFARELAGIAAGILRGIRSENSVWIFDVTPQEIGADGPWFNVNVTATFRYQEVA